MFGKLNNMAFSSGYFCDVLIIGSATAGLALRLADKQRVTVLSKKPVHKGVALLPYSLKPTVADPILKMRLSPVTDCANLMPYRLSPAMRVTACSG